MLSPRSDTEERAIQVCYATTDTQRGGERGHTWSTNNTSAGGRDGSVEPRYEGIDIPRTHGELATEEAA